MPITNQRAAAGRCDVRRSDVILLILCRARSTCVHGALLTTLLPLLPLRLFTRRNFGERSDTGVEEYERYGFGREARNQSSMPDVASDRDRHLNTVIPHPPTLLDDETPRARAPIRDRARTRVEYRGEEDSSGRGR